MNPEEELELLRKVANAALDYLLQAEASTDELWTALDQWIVLTKNEEKKSA